MSDREYYDYILKKKNEDWKNIYHFREDLPSVIEYLAENKLSEKVGKMSKQEFLQYYKNTEHRVLSEDKRKDYMLYCAEYKRLYGEEMVNLLLPIDIKKGNEADQEEIDDDNADFFAKNLMRIGRDASVGNALIANNKGSFNNKPITDIIIKVVDITIANVLFCLEELHNFNEAELNICHYDKKTDIIYYHEGLYADYCYYSSRDDDEDWIFKYSEFPKFIEN